jgi:hypothetical protein
VASKKVDFEHYLRLPAIQGCSGCLVVFSLKESCSILQLSVSGFRQDSIDHSQSPASFAVIVSACVLTLLVVFL